MFLTQDEADITIINHSLLYDGNDEPISSCIPIVRRLQQANQRKSTTSDDSIEVIVEPCQQIELILNTYRQELTNDSNTDWTCHQQLTARLSDLLRTMHSSNENQMKTQENLFADIIRLQNQRLEQQNSLTTSSQTICQIEKENDMSIKYSPVIFNRQECKELNDETLRLQQIVRTQHEKIETLIELLSERNLLEQTFLNDLHFSPCSSIDS